MNVKIIGAGSIGNHLAQAARRMDWTVTVVDRDPEALRRMKEEIYPSRYGAWDEKITLKTTTEEPKGGFDIICIGTPPDVRMRIARAALAEKPKILQLEKPLCVPHDVELEAFLKEYGSQSDTSVIVGYDHAVSESIACFLEKARSQEMGDALTLDVEFREHWSGIFRAHPWLSGPRDTYLGFWKRGGGSGGEHSHAMHLWLYISKSLNFGNIKKVKSMMDMRNEEGTDYDAIAAFLMQVEDGRIGRVVQDVVTKPAKKMARVQAKNGYVEWICNGHPKGDIVRSQVNDAPIEETIIEKKRPDDFYREMLHIQNLINGLIKKEDSPLSIDYGVEVVRILESSYRHEND